MMVGVSHVMGTPHEWLARPEAAKVMMESLLASEIAPSPKSGVLANNIILGLEGTRPTYASRGFMGAQAYWLNGHQICREMQIPEPSLYHTSLVLGQCLLFMTSGYISRSIPYLDRRNIKVCLCLIIPHVFSEADFFHACPGRNEVSVWPRACRSPPETQHCCYTCEASALPSHAADGQ